MFKFQDIKDFEEVFRMAVIFTRGNYPEKSFFVIFLFYSEQNPMLIYSTSFEIETH